MRWNGDEEGWRGNQPIANSSGDSSGVPQTRQITAEQSPQVSGSVISFAHLAQYRIGEFFGASDMGLIVYCQLSIVYSFREKDER